MKSLAYVAEVVCLLGSAILMYGDKAGLATWYVAMAVYFRLSRLELRA